MKNEKSIGEKGERTALERWENEGGEVLSVPEIGTNDRVILKGKTNSASGSGLIDKLIRSIGWAESGIVRGGRDDLRC